MSFVDAVRSVLTQYVGFTGRARRSEYWYFALFGILVSIVLSFLQLATNTSWITTIVGLALFLPSLAVSVRRLHDTGRSGWWILIGLIPVIGTIVLIVFYVQDSQGDNQYGPSPKQFAGAYPEPPVAPQY
jgi:uncharacterized membrane protein YhaH (DUF805 family)